ncbi:MAG: putative selenate reductase subunit YgfK [Spirochaetaceae bacterium]|nr:putative selenate reductase subunit YgfK [Spirochaetaceae bacterium]
MSKVMKFTSLPVLMKRISGEYAAKQSIFEVPFRLSQEMFATEADSPGLNVMSGRASLPVGPAAGPHTQIAPNLVAAYLAGARVFELKTVQKNDRLDIEKPCIDARNEGHNVEWSTELSLEDARKEYINGWIAVNLLSFLFSRKPNDFFFNLSVGYTLEGIQSEPVDSFIEGMRRPETTHYWAQAMEELSAFVESETFVTTFGDAARDRARTLAAHTPCRPVHSVTLSTMHGCPPDEIEKIGRYLIEEKGFDTYIKLNPTLVGHDVARGILDRLGWDDIVLKRESFEHDLQFDQAISLVKSLSASAAGKGRRFGIKLSNTLANVNNGGVLPGAERYMSGRALFPITIRLAANLAGALPDFGQRFSFCGGVSALNAGDLIKAGLAPLTVVTDMLKPGGYLRLASIAKEAVGAMSAVPDCVDSGGLAQLAESSLTKPEYRQDWKAGTVSIARNLPLFDCFAAPCIEACPVNQKVPAYIVAQGEGNSEQALATILSDNPLAHTTGILCDHLCQEHCSRIDYEGPVRIRDVKLTAARRASLPAHVIGSQPKAKGKTAVIGAGPAGLACAYHLALSNYPVSVFGDEKTIGGVPASIIPRFRIESGELAADIDRMKALGVSFVSGSAAPSIESLRNEGFTSFFIATGARKSKSIKLGGEGCRVIDALEFLGRCNEEGTTAFAGIRNLVVAGGGNTACDAVRAAARIPGIESVVLSYRRTKKEMPADKEELENALAESKGLLELSLPETAKDGILVLRKMELGEKDASGRRKPVPTDKTLEVPCELLVAAVGEEPDRAYLESLGISLGKDGLPKVDAETLETSVPNLYVGGDARRGPASIIAAEADGRKAAVAILAKVGIKAPAADYYAPLLNKEKLARRGEMIISLPFDDPDFAAREAERCLACDSACLRCVEVCPNRANIYIELGRPFVQGAQILHVDRLCNECGNCGLFCPYEGEPFKGKATLFDSMEELRASGNAGFAFIFSAREQAGLALRLVPDSSVMMLDYASWNGAASIPAAENMIALAREVYRHHFYLVEEQR